MNLTASLPMIKSTSNSSAAANAFPLIERKAAVFLVGG